MQHTNLSLYLSVCLYTCMHVQYLRVIMCMCKLAIGRIRFHLKYIYIVHFTSWSILNELVMTTTSEMSRLNIRCFGYFQPRSLRSQKLNVFSFSYAPSGVKMNIFEGKIVLVPKPIWFICLLRCLEHD